MAIPESTGITDRKRGINTPKGSRAIASRGLHHSSPPETNVPLGGISELVPDKQYRISGLDIGEASFSKKGVGSLDKVSDAYFKRPGSQVVVTGNVSPSVRTGSADVDLARRRAQSAKALLMKRGVPETSIRIEETPQSNLDPRSRTPEQKADMRGASIEIIPPPRVPHTDRGFTDDAILVKSEKIDIHFPRIPDLPNLPSFGSLFEHVKKPLQEQTKKVKERAANLVKLAVGAGLLLTLLPELASEVGIEATLSFLPYLVDAAAEEYGRDKVKKYVEEKLKKRLKDRANERNRTEEDRFMRLMLQRITAGGLNPKHSHHPLYFLVDPSTGDWKARKAGLDFAVQPGHTLSHKAYGFAFAIEDAVQNQRYRGDKIETPGGFAFSVALKIGDVYIDRGTAQSYENLGYLPRGTCDKATTSVGWIDF